MENLAALGKAVHDAGDLCKIAPITTIQFQIAKSDINRNVANLVALGPVFIEQSLVHAAKPQTLAGAELFDVAAARTRQYDARIGYRLFGSRVTGIRKLNSVTRYRYSCSTTKPHTPTALTFTPMRRAKMGRHSCWPGRRLPRRTGAIKEQTLIVLDLMALRRHYAEKNGHARGAGWNLDCRREFSQAGPASRWSGWRRSRHRGKVEQDMEGSSSHSSTAGVANAPHFPAQSRPPGR